MSVAVVGLVIQKYGGCLESHVGYRPSEFGNGTWLVRYHLVNLGHELGLVSKGFLIKLPERLTLLIHGLLWEFPNRQATQRGSFLNLLISLVIIPPL